MTWRVLVLAELSPRVRLSCRELGQLMTFQMCTSGNDRENSDEFMIRMQNSICDLQKALQCSQ